MKKLLLTGLLAAGVFNLQAAIADDDKSDTDRAHPGTFAKDSVITAKVKSKLAAKHLSTLTKIKVDTDHHVVVLSGKAPTQDAVDMAAMIAKDTEGVESVRNNIVVAADE